MNKFMRTMPQPKISDFFDALGYARQLLYVHGYITKSEKVKIDARIEKDYQNERKKISWNER